MTTSISRLFRIVYAPLSKYESIVGLVCEWHMGKVPHICKKRETYGVRGIGITSYNRDGAK